MRHDSHFVDDLAGRTGSPIGRMIPIARLEPNPNQPRSEMGDLTELIESIREKGVLEPLLVRPSQVGGRYMIISGERRYRASVEAGLQDLPCIEMNVDDREVAEIALIENLQRKDLTPFEEGNGFQALVERFGYTHAMIAQRLGKSRTSITESLVLLSIPVEIRDLCRRADITSKTTLLQIARQPDLDSMIKLIEQIRLLGLNRDQVRQVSKSETPETRKSQPLSYRPQNGRLQIDIRFRKKDISREEVITALEEMLDEVKCQSDW